MKKKYKQREFSREECYEIFWKYVENMYRFYLNNAWMFGCMARRYAEYLYRTYYLYEKFEKYSLKTQRIAQTDTFRVFMSDGSFSIVRITNNQIELDGKITDEEDFEKWLERGTR